jgi:hypothetical protein
LKIDESQIGIWEIKLQNHIIPKSLENFTPEFPFPINDVKVHLILKKNDLKKSNEGEIDINISGQIRIPAFDKPTIQGIGKIKVFDFVKTSR